MQTLGRDTLQSVLSHLEFPDLLAASSSCRLLRDATADPAGPLWRDLCHRRWGCAGSSGAAALNTGLYSAEPSGTDYKAIFMQDNGWGYPRALSIHKYPGAAWADEVVAVQPALPAAAGGACSIAVSSSRELRILSLEGPPDAQLRVQYAGSLAAQPHGELWSSVVPLPPESPGSSALVAAGGCRGRLALFRLPRHCSPVKAPHTAGSISGPDTAGAIAQEEATLAFPGNSCMISQLHHLPATNRLVVLHDMLAHLDGPPAPHSMLSVVDAASWRQLGPGMADVLDGYELAGAVPVGDSGSEFIAGSVKLSEDQRGGGTCQRCPPVPAPASTCWHKNAASSAALCLFDCRAAQAMVGRYSTHHRSLHPHLESLREHFLLTSHAGTPVAVWDRRQMNGPVHEVERVARIHGRHLPGAGLHLRREQPEEVQPPANQALHLSATAGLLLGRADNGACWLWDLSERLGWADGRQFSTNWLRQAASGGGLAPPPRVAAAAGASSPSDGGADWTPSESSGEEGGEEEEEQEQGGDLEEDGPLLLGCIAPPYEVWRSHADEAERMVWQPTAAAWMTDSGLLALGSVEVEELRMFFKTEYAPSSLYPSNALVVASLPPRPPRRRHQG